MSISFRTNSDGSNGAIQLNGTDRIVMTSSGNVTFKNSGTTKFEGTVEWPASGVIKPEDFTGTNVLLSAHGYQKLPSGLIIQWGNGIYGNAAAVTFPIAFPSACLQVVVSPANFDNAQAAYQKVVSVSGYSQTTTGFTASSSTAVGAAAKWIAIGY